MQGMSNNYVYIICILKGKQTKNHFLMMVQNSQVAALIMFLIFFKGWLLLKMKISSFPGKEGISSVIKSVCHAFAKRKKENSLLIY